jgi:hypothetical protein
MRVRIWESGVQVCDASKGIWWASDQTKYNYDCGNGAKATVTDNGAKLTYTASDGWTTTIDKFEGDRETIVCGTKPSRSGMDIDIKGWNFEYIFANDQCANCPKPVLCDHDSSNCKFDAKCS